MLDEFGEREEYSRVTLLGVFIVAKVLRGASLYSSFSFLRLLNYPSSVWAFWVLTFAAAIFMGIQRPWRGQRIDSRLWGEIAVHGGLQAIQMIFYFMGLKYLGPLRTILFSDFADVTFVFIAGIFFSQTRDKMHFNRKRGIALLLLGYVVLFLFDAAPIPRGLDKASMGDFKLGMLNFSPSKVGALCLIIATLIEILRKKIRKALVHNVGGSKRLNAFSTAIAAAVTAPIALFAWITAPDNAMRNVVGWFTLLEALAFSVLVFGLLDFYVETLLKSKLKAPLTMQASLIGATITIFLLELFYREVSVQTSTVFAFILIGLGQYLVYKVPAASPFGNLPLDRGGSFSLGVSTVVRDLMQRIKTNKDARNIFLYLSLNMLFMFIELGYGMWNNSLGLISDGFHMLFDSTALLIGLIAMVIAEWQPNKVYSFGYGRVNVLSGFINAIFLVFIACSVFYEAIQRFIEPPHIENDKLLLVSVLGLLVNLVGLFVFSQAHGAAHGHSHSHGHSHAHGSKKKKDKKKDHGHSHSHGSKLEECEDEEAGLHDDHGHAHSKKDKKKHDHHDDHDDENLHGIFLHVLGDTLGSVGVIISSIFIEFFNWTISDPICSLIIAFFLFLSVGPLLKSSSSILLQKTPSRVERKLPGLLQAVQEIPSVVGVTEPHFWSTDGNDAVGSIHVLISAQANSQSIIQKVNSIFSGAGVSSMTIQVEQAGAGEEQVIPSWH